MGAIKLNSIMETKTIRFEKGEKYPLDEIPTLGNEFYQKYFDTEPFRMWECLKSFTVQINIIEDEQAD